MAAHSRSRAASCRIPRQPCSSKLEPKLVSHHFASSSEHVMMFFVVMGADTSGLGYYMIIITVSSYSAFSCDCSCSIRYLLKSAARTNAVARFLPQSLAALSPCGCPDPAVTVVSPADALAQGL